MRLGGYLFFKELHIPIEQLPLILCDNIGANQLSLNPFHHYQLKLIAIDLYFVAKGLPDVHHVSSHDQMANLMTKSHPRSHFKAFRFKIGIINGESILRGHVKDSSCNVQRNRKILAIT